MLFVHRFLLLSLCLISAIELFGPIYPFLKVR